MCLYILSIINLQAQMAQLVSQQVTSFDAEASRKQLLAEMKQMEKNMILAEMAAVSLVSHNISFILRFSMSSSVHFCFNNKFSCIHLLFLYKCLTVFIHRFAFYFQILLVFALSRRILVINHAAHFFYY
jgi:hypothetical protein